MNNPHVFGLNALEVFFLDDRVILVEGPEDVVFYKKILADLNVVLLGEFFGWGVGGADKMQKVASILEELGFQKVAGLLDRGKEDVAENLRIRFPGYRFHVIPAEDIRTKKGRSSTRAVEGILDENFKVRTQYRQDMVELLEKVNGHFLGRDAGLSKFAGGVK